VRPFWPAGEAAQADYELLRQVALAGGASMSVAARRFERRGLAGLIAWPEAEAVFSTRVTGAVRPAWTPHVDPRVEALAAGFKLLLTRPIGGALILEEAR
jgi:selenophosphate synthase